MEKNKDSLKEEYLLPVLVGDMLREKTAEVTILETEDKWIGITYKEDVQAAKDGFKKMTAEGVYPQQLWEA